MFRLVLMSCLLSSILLGEDKVLVVGSGYGALSDGRYFLYLRQIGWHAAIANCFLLGKQLATFNSKAEYDQLVRLINKYRRNGDKSSYWVAGSDLSKYNEYVWITTGNTVTYTSWYPGEPNHGTPNGVVEHCIQLRYEDDFQMNDWDCALPNYFVCENK